MPTNILMPALSPTMEEGILSKWFVKEGDEVEPGDLLAEIETDKATMEFESIYEGKVVKILVTEGTTGVKVNAPIALIETGDAVENETPEVEKESVPEAKSSEIKETPKPVKTVSRPVASGKRIFASPLAKRLAKENDIPLENLSGTGHKSRIIKRDIEEFLSNQKAQPTPTSLPQAQGMPA